jgi:hypothetical protein
MLPFILSSMSDDQVVCVRVAASWTLSQMIKNSIQVLNIGLILQDIIPTLVRGLYVTQQKIVYYSCLVSSNTMAVSNEICLLAHSSHLLIY